MNSRHCVHFASQGSTGSDSLAILRLRNDELISIGLYYQLAVNNGVKSRGYKPLPQRADPCVHFYQLRADETPLPAEDGNPQRLRSASIVESNDLMWIRNC